MSTTRVLKSSASSDKRRRFSGVERGEIVEEDLLGQKIGVLTVDGFNAEEREVAFVFLGGANLTCDSGSSGPSQSSDLAG